MDKKKIIKLAGLNIGITLFDIVLLSHGCINTMGQTDLYKAAGITALIMSVLVFFYGNYKLLSQKGRTVQISGVHNWEDCILALRQAYGKKTFDSDIGLILGQIERLQKKNEKIKGVLLQKFNIIDTAYERFSRSISDVEYVFIENIKSILNKINAFDEEDYRRVTEGNVGNRLSKDIVASKLSIYNEFIGFVKNSIDANEEILIKLDALLLEISGFNSLEAGEIDNMTEIKEMDELIRKSKYYR